MKHLGALNPAVNETVLRPTGSVYDPQFVMTTNIPAVQVRWDDYNAYVKKLVQAYYEGETTTVKLLTAQLTSTCPPASVGVVKNSACYNFAATTLAQTVPGGFEIFGVPFNAFELGVTKSPKFDRSYQPNSLQRTWLEWMIIKRSRERFDNDLRYAVQRLSSAGGTLFPSVEEALQLLPRYALVVNNMSVRSVSPTTDEFTKRGGLKKWLKRGGFPISLDVLEGKTKLYDEALCPVFCTSILCRCGASPLPACIGQQMAEWGGPGGCFWAYASIDQQAPWAFRLVLEHDDPSWFEKAGSAVQKGIEKAIAVLCQVAPAAQQQLSQTVAEKCVNKQGKTCTKGSKDCTCTKVSAAATGSVGLANFAIGAFCAGWQAQGDNFTPTQVIPPTPDAPLLPATSSGMLSFLPWVVGGLAVGAVAFTRK